VVTLDCNQAAVSLFIVLHKDRCLVQEQQMIASKVLVCYVIICLSVFFLHFWILIDISFQIIVDDMYA